MKSETYHKISSLTTNVTVAPTEAGVWKKIMLEVAKLKVKVTEGQRTVNLLEKLRSKGLGTNQVEEFAKKDMGRGRGSERRRKVMVKAMMRGKVEDAKVTVALIRERLKVRGAYLTRRWGHCEAAMIAFKVICQELVESIWKDRGEKDKKKLQHLEQRWRRGGEEWVRRKDIDGEWRGIKIGDRELEQVEKEKQEQIFKPVLKYGEVETTAEEDSLLSLPSKFATYEPVTKEKVEVALQVCLAKARWELRSRRGRVDENDDQAGQVWSEEWELKQQEEKTVYCPEEHKMDFSKRRVTDMKTCRSVITPQ